MTDTALSPEQLARAEALGRARTVIVATSMVKVEFPHEVTGLARYIIDGIDVFNLDADTVTFAGTLGDS